MVIPNYSYLKLKMLGPNSVITVSGSFEQAYVSSREHFDLAVAAANSAELIELRATVTECRPDCAKSDPATAFRPTNETKAVAVDPTDPTKTVWIGSQLPSK